MQTTFIMDDDLIYISDDDEEMSASSGDEDNTSFPRRETNDKQPNKNDAFQDFINCKKIRTVQHNNQDWSITDVDTGHVVLRVPKKEVMILKHNLRALIRAFIEDQGTDYAWFNANLPRILSKRREYDFSPMYTFLYCWHVFPHPDGKVDLLLRGSDVGIRLPKFCFLVEMFKSDPSPTLYAEFFLADETYYNWIITSYDPEEQEEVSYNLRFLQYVYSRKYVCSGPLASPNEVRLFQLRDKTKDGNELQRRTRLYDMYVQEEINLQRTLFKEFYKQWKDEDYFRPVQNWLANNIDDAENIFMV